MTGPPSWLAERPGPATVSVQGRRGNDKERIGIPLWMELNMAAPRDHSSWAFLFHDMIGSLCNKHFLDEHYSAGGLIPKT